MIPPRQRTQGGRSGPRVYARVPNLRAQEAVVARDELHVDHAHVGRAVRIEVCGLDQFREGVFLVGAHVLEPDLVEPRVLEARSPGPIHSGDPPPSDEPRIPATHAARNIGDTVFREVLVEFKRPA